MTKQRIRDWIRKKLLRNNTFKMVITYNYESGELSHRLVCKGEACSPKIILGTLNLITDDLVSQMEEEGQIERVEHQTSDPTYID